MKAMNQPNDNANSGGKYALGHSQEELDRLKEHDIVRLIDLMFVKKNEEGELETVSESEPASRSA